MEKNNINNRHDYIILMADIVKSREEDQAELMQSFKEIIHKINKEKRKFILSPLTITIGDEFQAVFEKLSDAIEIIIALEEMKILTYRKFQLRYTIVEGVIETPINTKIAYEMLGEGLTLARESLNRLKSSTSNYAILLRDQAHSKVLNEAFLIFNEIKSEWDLEKDSSILAGFILEEDYKTIAEKLKKDRAQIWRKEKSLRIKQYFASKSIIKYIGGLE